MAADNHFPLDFITGPLIWNPQGGSGHGVESPRLIAGRG